MPLIQNLFAEMARRRPFTVTLLPVDYDAPGPSWSLSFRDGSQVTYTGTRIEATCFARCYDRLFLAPSAPASAASLSEAEKLEMAEGVAAEMAEVEQDHLNARLYA